MGQQQQQGATSIVLQAHWDSGMVLGAASTWVTAWCCSGTRYNSAKHWTTMQHKVQQYDVYNMVIRSIIVMMGAAWCSEVQRDDEMQHNDR